MKKHNIVHFLKSKSFYVVLFVAVIAIAAVTVVALNRSPEESKNENLVDLNTPVEVADNEETNIGEDSENAANTTETAANDNNIAKDEYVIGDYTNDELLEFDVGSFTTEESEENEQMADASSDETVPGEVSGETVNDETTSEAHQTAQAVGPEQTEESAKTEDEMQTTKEEEAALSVMQPKVTLDSLSFSRESILSWPVKGNVILPFSMENLVHYATLDEWKTNPAIIISSEVGTEVTAAVKGIVSNITFDEETGTTVTMSIGNGYEIVYGQLDEVTCDIGEAVEAGRVIAKVASPTKYYSIEGSNLYLQVLSDGIPVNPMLFLSGEE